MREINLEVGNVKKKKIITHNPFISHMIEHIAWRLGVGINLVWQDENWHTLGEALGRQILRLGSKRKAGVALGMIDESSSEIKIEPKGKNVRLSSTGEVDLEWFLNLRVEQLESGKGLVEFLEGLSRGINSGIEIKICNVDDPHHAWEAIFRGVGIALSKSLDIVPKMQGGSTDIEEHAKVLRKTAESIIELEVDFTRKIKNNFLFLGDKSAKVNGLKTLLEILRKEAGFNLSLNFTISRFYSSHVVFEDTGIILGRALFIILGDKMKRQGINGAGSNIQKLGDMNKPIGVGISIEGRKSLCFIDSLVNYKGFKEYLIGKDVLGLRSEDLDDFLDGFCTGFQSNMVIHVRKMVNHEIFWKQIFRGLGESIKETLAPNPSRKGLPPGVKATLL